MIDDLWIKIFFLIYFCIIGLGVGIDSAYYAKHFRRDKGGRKDKP